MLGAAPLVLVVEDDRDIVESVVAILERGGYRVRAASDGTGAIDAVADGAVGLVLLDWRLPEGPSGEPLVRRLREACGPNLPIVVLSADPTSLEEARAAQVSDYLPKPFDVEDLLHVVDAHCR